MDTIAERLAAGGHILPAPPEPAALYAPFTVSGPFAFLSGQIGAVGGEARFPGRLGGTLSLEDGKRAAEAAALDVLSQLAVVTDGAADRVARVVRLSVFIAATPDFRDHPAVADGASAVFEAVFGLIGRHARTAIGVASLPRGAAVEVEVIVELVATT